LKCEMLSAKHTVLYDTIINHFVKKVKCHVKNFTDLLPEKIFLKTP
jgi:hypothetical protein